MVGLIWGISFWRGGLRLAKGRVVQLTAQAEGGVYLCDFL